jgi:tRNA(Ile)-lysidine synthase
VAWQSLHPALRRYALRRASARLGIAELSFTHIEAAHAAINTGGPRRLTLAHGLLLDVGYNCAYIISADAPPSDAVPQIAAEPVPIPAPGRTPLGRGWVCVTQREPPAQPSPWWVAIPAKLTSNLALRRRRPGDRFRPAGGRGGRRLQDLFVDRKIPQSLRDAWPILVADQAILWVAGLRADERVGAPGAGDIFWVGIVREEEEQQDDAR